jgi:PD-(D/E)XK endonuclease
VAKRKAKTTHKIQDKKKRGEWVELRFMAEAAERGLAASKPFGDSENFDVVVGRPGKFVAVQVKCTTFLSKSGEGYMCSVCNSPNIYPPGAFDFLAAYVVPKDVWYILPMKEIQGMRSVTLCLPTGKYEKYLEAWKLLREAVGVKEDPAGAESETVEESPKPELGRGEIHPSGGMARMEAAFAYMRRRMERR